MLAVAERPDDLSLRLVVAEALSERGNPRGEFIALQCAHRDLSRARALLREHGESWLSPEVRDVIVPGSAVFSRGFLSACRLKPHIDVRPSLRALDWQTVRCVSNPTVALVRELPWLTQLRAVPDHVAVDLLRGPPMPAVHSLEITGDASFTALMRVWREATGAPNVTTLRLVRHGDQFYPHRLDPLFREGAVPLRRLELVLRETKLVRWVAPLEASPLASLAFISERSEHHDGWWWLRYEHREAVLRVAATSERERFSWFDFDARMAASTLRAVLKDFPMESVRVRGVQHLHASR